ncbi:arylamine N-acetyltransferase family protein [Nocardiopsis ganjiahuensis]|uniref:arylamine N-acetyltransferase family protein n=1 Tax=Nocardiopsis ganjiahuensis TaxID=239984 RepID=UPI00034D25B5|nr:arylamine N-acetyltransferase [Nocardiopsis ganjiahuensis]
MLDEMLTRIDYHGALSVHADTLKALHRAWRRAVPYENLDIQLGRPIRLDGEAVFDKFVRRGRGGYCYEQNAALAMLLRAAGFRVTVVEGAVLRESRGEAMWGNHCALLVDVGDERWLADAGIGDGFLEPLPLREGPHVQSDQEYRLERLDPDTWRFHHRPGATIASYDFRLEPREITDFAEHSDRLSSSPESAYVTTLMAARPVSRHTHLLLSRTVRVLGSDSAPSQIANSDDFAAILRDTFLIALGDLGPGAVERLWEAAGSQHDLWRSRAAREAERG